MVEVFNRMVELSRCSPKPPGETSETLQVTVNQLSGAKSFKSTAKQVGDVAFDLRFGRLPASLGEVFVFFHQDAADDFAGMTPFIYELVQNAGVGVLRREAQAEHLDAHAGELVDDRWIVVEPPAAEDVQVAEFAGEHGQFELVFARENGDGEFVFGKLRTQRRQRLQIAQAHAVAG